MIVCLVVVSTNHHRQCGHIPVLVVTASSIFCVPPRDHGSRTKKEQEEVVSMDIDEPGEMLCVVCNRYSMRPSVL